MHISICSVAIILLAFSLTNAQIYEEPNNVLNVVNGAFGELLTVLDNSISDGHSQGQTFLFEAYKLATSITFLGPVPAVVDVVKYWLANLTQNLLRIIYKVIDIYQSILKSLQYQLVQLTNCSINDVYQLFSVFIQQLEWDTINILNQSTQNIYETIKNGVGFTLHLKQIAVQNCNANLAGLGKTRHDNLSGAFRKLDNEFAQHYALVRSSTIALINALYYNLNQMISCSPPAPFNAPTTC